MKNNLTPQRLYSWMGYSALGPFLSAVYLGAVYLPQPLPYRFLFSVHLNVSTLVGFAGAWYFLCQAASQNSTRKIWWQLLVLLLWTGLNDSYIALRMFKDAGAFFPVPILITVFNLICLYVIHKKTRSV
ncbi:hypothetical protein [Bdellovibrio sp. HCB288]|uniref:hypothetical protein n=1 Tax=Bdellovibrio sp. HCB288 TaxID=3394355 RepID=UPI0039B6017D